MEKVREANQSGSAQEVEEEDQRIDSGTTGRHNGGEEQGQRGIKGPAQPSQEVTLQTPPTVLRLTSPPCTITPSSTTHVSHTESPFTSSPSPLIRYADYLRAVYKRSPVAIDKKKWPPTPSKTYIRLALITKEKVSQKDADKFTRLTLQGDIDKILKTKKKIEMKDILKDNDICLVVVEGAPGIGKSTLAWELCRQWPTLESLKHFSLVVLHRLREERVQRATDICDLFPCLDEPDLGRCVGEEMKKRKGEGVLLVFDGFDEFPANLRRKSLVVDVISGSYLPKATVLVTSRPSVTAELLSVCQADLGKHIEVVGFSDKEIQEYAESILQPETELLASFQTYLSANPVVRGMMYNPLNCGIVVGVYQNSSLLDRPIPHTQTELYTELSLCLLSRHLSAAGNPLARRLPDKLEDLPREHTFCEKLKRVGNMLRGQQENAILYQQLVSLGRLAFEGRVSDQVIFKRLPEGCSALGLLNTCSELYGRRENVTYNFLHLTLQEYLGAFYISQLPASEQEKLLVEHCELGHLNVVWRFVAGLTRMKGIGWEVFKKGKEKGSGGYMVKRDVVRVWPSLVQCLYEAQDAKSCASVFDQSTVDYVGRDCSTPFDAYALGYCMSILCNNKWNVDLGGSGLGPEMVMMLVCGLNSKSAHDDGGSVENFTHQSLQKMEKLNLSSCNLDQTGFDLLADIVPHLSTSGLLNISLNPGGNGSTVKLLQALGTYQKVKCLKMMNTEIGRDDIVALSEVFQQSRSLRELHIGSNPNISPECVEQMMKTTLSPSSLEKLYISVPPSVSALDYIETISDNLSLLSIDSASVMQHSGDVTLSENVKQNKGSTKLSNILKENTTLKALVLIIPLESTEVREIVESLKHNHTLAAFSLFRRYHSQYFSESERQALDHRIKLK